MKIKDYIKISDFLPIRCVFDIAEHKGFVENSFTMDWAASFVRIWWSGGTYELEGEKHAAAYVESFSKPNIVSLDPLDPACPYEVDLNTWIREFQSGARKYYCRNAFFKLKGS